jgi:hypothetical protein
VKAFLVNISHENIIKIVVVHAAWVRISSNATTC